MTNKPRPAFVVTGFLVAPLVAAIAMVSTTPLVEDSVTAALGLVPIFYLFAALASGMLGVPAFLVLQRVGLVRWWSSSIAGAVIGATITFLLVSPPTAVTLKTLWYFMAVGACSGLSFWVVWRVGAPTAEPFLQEDA